jgi:two-component system, LuxR family, response regulator FixJ
MVKNDKHSIFLVDDEPIVLETIGDTLKENYTQVHCFTRAVDCIEHLGRKTCDLLITDLKMPEMDGMELLTRAKQLLPWMPVLVITGFGDIPTAVTAIQVGAAGFIEKPLERELFLRKVQSLLYKDAIINSSIIGKVLTEMECKVLELVVKGKSSKEIAHLLHHSTRTIEWHRSHIMGKLGVDNVVGLIKRTAAMGMVELPERQEHNKGALNEELSEKG